MKGTLFRFKNIKIMLIKVLNPLFLLNFIFVSSVLLLFFLNKSSLADGNDVYLKVGTGLNSPEGSPPSTERIVATGIQQPFFWLLDYQLEGGIFQDTGYLSPTTSGYMGPSIGVSIVERYYYLKLFSGAVSLTNPDNRLGGIFQFNHDIELGLSDYRGVSIGIDYKHMSSAGIEHPNLGRDWLILKVQFPLERRY